MTPDYIRNCNRALAEPCWLVVGPPQAEAWEDRGVQHLGDEPMVMPSLWEMDCEFCATIQAASLREAGIYAEVHTSRTSAMADWRLRTTEVDA